MCLSSLVSLTLTLLPAVLPSSTLLTKMPNPCSEPPRTLKPSLPSTLFSTVMALMTSLSLLLAVGTREQINHTHTLHVSTSRPRAALPAPRPSQFRHQGPPDHRGGQGAGTPHTPSMGALMRMTRPMGEAARVLRVVPLSRRLCLLRR